MNNRVCDASIRSMLEEFQILNSIFRLYYEYHLDLCNELNCLSDFLKTSNLSKAIYCLIPNTDGLVDRLRQSSWWEENDGAAWILVMKVGVRRFSNLSKAILRDCLKYRCCLIPNTAGLADGLCQSSWWEENDGAAWIFVMKIGSDACRGLRNISRLLEV